MKRESRTFIQVHQTVKAARIAGAIYLSTLPFAIFFWSYVPGELIVRGNAIATANNIQNQGNLVSAWVLGDLFGQVLFIALGFALYRLLADVNRTWALLMLGLVFVSGSIGCSNTLNIVAAVNLFRGADPLTVVDESQRLALAMSYVRLHASGVLINEIFWGLWLLPFGLLVYRSGFLPRVLGIWLIIACFGWLSNGISGLCFPDVSETIFRISQPIVLGEMAVMLWLLIMGAKVRLGFVGRQD